MAEKCRPRLAALVFRLVYQQLENLWLPPRLSARTMEINGAVAFGAAIAGGAVAVPRRIHGTARRSADHIIRPPLRPLLPPGV
jgi:hypothetical protein